MTPTNHYAHVQALTEKCTSVYLNVLQDTNQMPQHIAAGNTHNRCHLLKTVSRRSTFNSMLNTLSQKERGEERREKKSVDLMLSVLYREALSPNTGLKGCNGRR